MTTSGQQEAGPVLEPAGPAPRHRLEALWVTLLAAASAVVMTWPQLRTPTRTVPQDAIDPLLISWQLAWAGHALRTLQPDVFTTPAFLGAPDNLAFTDATLGYAPLGLLFGDTLDGALLQFNVAGVFAVALAFGGAYVLARVLGSAVPGALVAGAGFAFAPWRLAQVTHTNVQAYGGLALSLALLLYGHGWSLRAGFGGRLRPGWALAGWLVAAWQLTLGFAIGITFGYVLVGAVLLLAVGWLVHARRLPPVRTLLADLLGAALFAAVTWWLAAPFFRVVQAHPEGRRDVRWPTWLSPPWRSLLIAPDTDVFWGQRQRGLREQLWWPPEMSLSPGVLLIALAALGVLVSAWPWRRRLGLLAAVAGFTLLTLGTRGPAGGRFTFLPLYHALPGWDAMRAPGRTVVWVSLGLCLLAAGAVTRLGQVGAGRPGRRRASGALAAVLLLPVVLIALEGRGDVPQREIPRPPLVLAELPQPLLILPSAAIADYSAMAWQADGWFRMANGSSGFEPAFQERFRAEIAGFPDQASVAALRRRGIRTVVLMPERVGGTPWEGALERPVDGLGVRRTEVNPQAVRYDLG